MSVKTSIGWCNLTLNPVLGLCKGNCRLPDGRAYCYYSGDRGIAHRFKQNSEVRLDLSVFDKLPKSPKRVFLWSTHEPFGSWILRKWRESILDKVRQYPQHTFLVLTKLPENIDVDFPSNVQLGVTATDTDMAVKNLSELAKIEALVKFISFEPLLGRIPLTSIALDGIHQVIIGRLTGFGKKYDSQVSWVQEIALAATKAHISLFLKDNLRSLLPNRMPFWCPVSWTVIDKGASIRMTENRLRQEIPR